MNRVLLISLVSLLSLSSAIADEFLKASSIQGKVLFGNSYSKNWKETQTNDLIKEFFEVATAENGIACFQSSIGHTIALLPNSRMKFSFFNKKSEGKQEKYEALKIELIQGIVMAHAAVQRRIILLNTKFSLESMESRVFGARLRKENKYSVGMLTESGTFSNVADANSENSLTGRQYVNTSSLSKFTPKKMSFEVQKRLKSPLDVCLSPDAKKIFNRDDLKVG
ncbi:MAG: hypothetical protein ACPGJV_12300, partial [Bacteriovoracaceae bacterium]